MSPAQTALGPVLASLLAISGAACAYYPKDEGLKLRDQTYALQTQVNAMQQTLTEVREAQNKHTEALTQLSRDLEALNKLAGKGTADLGQQLEEAFQQVARLKGLVESFQERLSTLEANTAKTGEQLDILAKKTAESQQKNEAARKQALEDEKLLAGSPSAIFEAAQKRLAGGNPADARRLLRKFEIEAKDDKQAEKRLPEAQYLIGETFFAEENYQQAAAEYNAIRKNYPKSAKVPEALLRLGACFEKLNLKDDAKLFYQTVVQKYAHSSVARDAKERLRQLR